MPELKPCPFCGGTNLKINIERTYEYVGETRCSAIVKCVNCRAKGPVVRINMKYGQPHEREICEETAAEAWNRRVGNGTRMAAAKCALGRRGEPIGKNGHIYCLGWADPKTHGPYPECLACPDFADKAQGDND